METLFKTSLIISITGILILLFLANFLELETTEIGQINEKMINKKIKISGQVSEIKDKETFKILSIKDNTGGIEVLCNCKEIETNTKVEITGRIQEYQKNLQIQADKILQRKS